MSAVAPRVLHLDDEVVAIAKPAGLASIPERDLGLPSARAWAEAELGQRLWVVHRLDKEASGLLLFARDADTHRELCRSFEERRVHKIYLALLHGRLNDDAGLIDRPLRAFGSGRVAVDARRGKPSRTRYRVRERLPGHTLVQAMPETGRRHQLRAHFYAAGHPIVGDRRYGEAAAQADCPRLLLHALALELTRDGGRPLALRCAVDPSFAAEVQARGGADPSTVTGASGIDPASGSGAPSTGGLR